MTQDRIHQNITALPPARDVLYVTLFCQHKLSQIILFSEQHLLNPFLLSKPQLSSMMIRNNNSRRHTAGGKICVTVSILVILNESCLYNYV